MSFTACIAAEKLKDSQAAPTLGNYAGGSGSAYIYGFCDKNWRPGMSEADCRAFVVQAVSLAMARDGSSGGNIRTVVINKQGIFRNFIDGTQVQLFNSPAVAP